MAGLDDLCQKGDISLGTYLTVPHPSVITALAAAGLDFVRIDAFRPGWSAEQLALCVDTTLKAGLIPWARCLDENQGRQIAQMVAMGATVITVPGVDSVAQAQRIVQTVREAAARRTSTSQVLIGCQIETAQALSNCREIVRVDGVDIVHTGRNDLAKALRVEGGQFDDVVLDAERVVVETAWAAGKQVSLLFPVDARGRTMASHWIDRGVRIFALGNDMELLKSAFNAEINSLRAVSAKRR